jgi:hypothetical protein
VRLEVHTADLTTKWQDYYSSIYLQDGQTEELLAFITTRFDDKGTRRIAFLGFGCDITGDPSCVADKIVACMGGKECDPQ